MTSRASSLAAPARLGRGAPDARRATVATRLPLALGALCVLVACGGPPPLALAPRPVPVGHDGFDVLDAALVDPDHDADMDIVVSTTNGLAYLRNEGPQWTVETLGTTLEQLAPVTRLHPQGPEGLDFLAERDGRLVRLVYSGIGSWTESEEGAPPMAPPTPSEVVADFDRDGRPDRAVAQGRSVRVELRGADGALHDATHALGADALRLRGDAVRLIAADLDGDGDTDLFVIGGRLFALINNGGRFDHARDAAADGAPAPTPAPGERRTGRSGDVQRGLPGDGGARPPAAGDGARAAGAPGAPWFTDVTESAGLAFTHVEGDEQWDIRPTMGPGAAWADVDGDGDEDLYVVGGSGQVGRLLLNRGDATFTDGTAAWGLGDAPRRAGMGASFCDWDDDGDPDLYVTADGPNVMWRNDGGRFTDVTAAAGTGDPRWGAGAAWSDLDRDGDLDLVVANYLEFDPSLIPLDGDAPALRREDPIAMLPYVFPGQANVAWRNDGDGRFTDVTEAWGLLDPPGAPVGKSLGVAAYDHDGDGWPDLYVTNDTTPNTLWRNLGPQPDGGVAFEEIALFVGLDDPRGGMGLDFADVDDDGDEDLFVTYWQTEPNALYRNNAVHLPTRRRFVPRFEDVSVKAGLAGPSVGLVGWGCLLDDLDDDGDRDLLVANGYTSPDYETTMRCVGQPDQLYENVSGPGPFASHADVPRFELVSAERAGAAFGRAWASRGVAAADADGDGDLDLVITANNGPLALLRNERGGRSLTVHLRGTAPECPREALGARVTVELASPDGRSSRRTARLRRGSSYLSGHAIGVRFGLGAARAVRAEVEWPDGTRSTHDLPPQGVARLVQPSAP